MMGKILPRTRKIIMIDEVDSDQDGILDSVDLCPNTAFGVAVDTMGCPVEVDKDHDGVMDEEDNCPETSLGTFIDERGCPVSVEYPPNATDISSAFATELLQIGNVIKANPGRRFVVGGHTDSVGSELYNKNLSLLRAEKVKIYLVETLGVPESALETQGFGKSRPVAANDTQSGRQQNRRVDVLALPE